jgi:hypothetical protein
MLQSRLKDSALEVLGDKISDEDEKKKISEELHEIESNFDDKAHSLSRDLRDKLERLNKFSSSDKDDIVKKALKNLADTYNGV